jgi:hypothetical protein
VPKTALRDGQREPTNPTPATAFTHIQGCGKAARIALSATPEVTRQKPNSRLFPKQSAAPSMGAIKATPIAGNIPKESGASPQPWRQPKR